jgi:hypothetical protein
MTDRIPFGDLTADALDALYDERDQYATALKRPATA